MYLVLTCFIHINVGVAIALWPCYLRNKDKKCRIGKVSPTFTIRPMYISYPNVWLVFPHLQQTSDCKWLNYPTRVYLEVVHRFWWGWTLSSSSGTNTMQGWNIWVIPKNVRTMVYVIAIGYRIQRRTTFWVWSLVIFFAAAENIYLEWILQGTRSCPVVPPGFKFVTFSPSP